MRFHVSVRSHWLHENMRERRVTDGCLLFHCTLFYVQCFIRLVYKWLRQRCR